MQAETQPYLDQLGLNISSRTPLNQLSLAQQQMVEIAKALSLQAKILIMDEPTSSLTLTETQSLIRVVKELRSRGVSVFSTSRTAWAKSSSWRTGWSACATGATPEASRKEEITHDRMVSLMVGRDLDKYQAPAETAPKPMRFSVTGPADPALPGAGSVF